MRARFLIFAAACCLAAAGGATYALANGDPASDVLLQENIYFPTQKVSVGEATRLHSVVNLANKKGYPIRVALIGGPEDLGTVPNLFGKAQKYSEFLAPEIAFAYKGDLLVVMPSGVGVTNTDNTKAPAAAVKGLKVAGGPDGMSAAARDAVTRMAKAAGHPLSGGKKSGGGSAVAGIVVAVLLLLAGIIGAVMVRRQNAARAAVPAEPAPEATE